MLTNYSKFSYCIIRACLMLSKFNEWRLSDSKYLYLEKLPLKFSILSTKVIIKTLTLFPPFTIFEIVNIV